MKNNLLTYLTVVLFSISGNLFSQTYQPNNTSISSTSSMLSIDTDGDGIQNNIDLDDDNDGILDNIECSGNNIVTNGTFTGNANGWTTGTGWTANGATINIIGNNITDSDLSQNLSNLTNTNNFISLTITLGAQDGSQASGSTANLKILLNNILFATIDNSTVRNPAVNNITIALSNGATSDFIPFTTANINGYTTRTFTINIPNTAIPDTSNLVFRATTGIDDWSLDDISIKAFTFDTDGDGIFNHLDSDSDNDGCFDSIEGDENVSLPQINTNGSISGAVDTQGVPILVNPGGAADIGSDQGQGIGSSQNAAINQCDCFIAPIITSSSPTICFGGSVTLTSNQTTGNTWSTGATTQSIIVTTPGTYTLTYFNGHCISIPASITITAENDPNVQIAGNLTLCESATQLTASASGTGNIYTWSNGFTGNTISVSTPGTYTVTVKTPANCEYQKSVTVTQGVTPVVQNSSLSQCSSSAPATFDLTSAQSSISTTTGVSFDYYINQADALAGNTNFIVNPTAFVSGNTIIYVRVKSATCSKIAELQLIINQKPVPIITSSGTTICNSNSIILTSNFPTGNVWSNGQTTQSITINTPGIYTLTNNNGICTSDPTSIIITAGADPNLQITGNLTFCEGNSTILTATGSGTGNTFVWSNGVNGATNTITIPGTYTVTVTTSSGCQYQKSATVTMDPAITINIATPTQITCTNSQITLNATSSIYQPGATFLWTATGGGNIVSGGNTLTPIINAGGTYTLTITSSNPLGCVKQGSVTVISNINPPVISVTAPSLTICKGQSITLTASGATTYTWTGLSGSGNTQTVSPTSTTTYTVTGVGTNGCTSQIPGTIIINVVPEITSSLHNIEICKGETGILDAGTGSNYTYNWNTGATSQKINVTTEGTYTVTINNGACSKTFSAIVSYILAPEIIDVIYNNNTLTINIKNNGNTPAEYSIDGGISWQNSNTFTNVLKNTKYSIRVRNRGTSCDASVEYYTFFISNVITPNSDGKNDVIDFSEVTKYKNFEGSVFDKYGKEVFKPIPENPKWNGQYVSRLLPTDTYWYKLSWEEPISKKTVKLSGWVLLKNRD